MKLIEEYEEEHIYTYEIHKYDSKEESAAFLVSMKIEGWLLYSTQGLESCYYRKKVNKFMEENKNV